LISSSRSGGSCGPHRKQRATERPRWPETRMGLLGKVAFPAMPCLWPRPVFALAAGRWPPWGRCGRSWGNRRSGKPLARSTNSRHRCGARVSQGLAALSSHDVHTRARRAVRKRILGFCTGGWVAVKRTCPGVRPREGSLLTQADRCRQLPVRSPAPGYSGRGVRGVLHCKALVAAPSRSLLRVTRCGDAARYV
jgi:hypothetical protein